MNNLWYNTEQKSILIACIQILITLKLKLVHIGVGIQPPLRKTQHKRNVCIIDYSSKHARTALERFRVYSLKNGRGNHLNYQQIDGWACYIPLGHFSTDSLPRSNSKHGTEWVLQGVHIMFRILQGGMCPWCPPVPILKVQTSDMYQNSKSQKFRLPT